jgi:hypothetical protein
MTDIVERARADVLRSGTWADTGNLILEMADEIERLRAAIAAEREACTKIADEYDGAGMDASLHSQSGDAYTTRREIAAAIRNRSET